MSTKTNGSSHTPKNNPARLNRSNRSECFDFAYLGENIASLRRAAGMTQEMLALRLGVSSQAVSKWERQLSCPDLSLLPVMADLFGVSIDALFLDGKAEEETVAIDGLPWGEDGEMRVAVFEGRRLRLKEVYECPKGDLILAIHPGGETRSSVIKTRGSINQKDKINKNN